MSDIPGIKILQSCNGLFLCCTGRPSEHKYYVFNPTTKQVAVIPPVIGGQDVRENIRFMGLAFHQTECVHYKVVSVYRANSVPKPGKELYHIQIYSSDTGKWRISCESFHMSVIDTLFCRYGVYWNGAIHWDTFNNPFYFKLDEEQFQNLPLPDCYEPKVSTPYFKTCRYFGESRGHLHLVEIDHHKDPLHLNVYEMLSDHSVWFLKYQVDLHELLEACPEMIYGGYPVTSIPRYDLDIIDVVRGENEEDTFMMVRICRKIIRYNIQDKSFKLIFNLSGSVILKEARRYIETIGSF